MSSNLTTSLSSFGATTCWAVECLHRRRNGTRERRGTRSRVALSSDQLERAKQIYVVWWWEQSTHFQSQSTRLCMFFFCLFFTTCPSRSRTTIETCFCPLLHRGSRLVRYMWAFDSPLWVLFFFSYSSHVRAAKTSLGEKYTSISETLAFKHLTTRPATNNKILSTRCGKFHRRFFLCVYFNTKLFVIKELQFASAAASAIDSSWIEK